MKVLSLFDGMSCGMIAFQKLGIDIERYVAYEIDKHAIQTATHNFPVIEEKGDVFSADFTQYKDFDFLIGGSPCTYWSIAQSKNRETTASGLGWELFSQYVRALHDAKPRYFLYENNKSMSNDIRMSITNTFGFEPICINSSLVSAQNRQRLYWVGIRQDDGTYKKADIEQPEDKGIVLKDILETESSIDSNIVAQRGRYLENSKLRIAGLPTEQMYKARGDKKSNTLATVQKDNLVAEPVNLTKDGKAHTVRATYYKDGIRNLVANNIDKKTCVAESVKYINCESESDKDNLETYPSKKPIVVSPMTYGLESVTDKDEGIIGILDMPGSHDILRRVYGNEGKSPTLNTCAGGNTQPKVFSELSTTNTKGKKTPVYEVKNGMITVKGKTYPIKLTDGLYIIRKLTVNECKRLQTVPDTYEFPVSNSQAYKMLGNGWTVDVIAHIFKGVEK